LLGISTLRQPAGSQDPIAYVEMALKIRFSPDDGLLAAKAVLTPNSYILSKSCKLTGGFAFYAWFSGEHEGDFVVTLGGYHPQFAIPSHYPTVDRLGFNWKIGSDITVKGECYFALTPSSIMAGGRLSAVYEHGRLRAWFIAYADFLIRWEPFHYDIGIGVSIGASYRMSIFWVSHTFSIELGAQLHLWGPPFAGTARISWWIISFTIRFGAYDQRPKKDPISWDHFRKSFLPQSKDEPAKPDPIHIGITGGLIKESKDSNGKEYKIVNPDQLALAVQTAIPVTAIHLNGHVEKEEKNLGVRPMEATTLESSLIIVLRKEHEDIEMKMKRITKGVPEALWSPRPAEERLNKTPIKQVIKDVLTGAQFSVPDPKAAPRKISINLSQRGFSERRGDVSVRKAPEIEPAETYDEETALESLRSSIKDVAVQSRREAILGALGRLGFEDLTSGVNLERMADSVKRKDTLLAPPILAGIGKRRQRQTS
jgi:hypothetical protein